MTTNTAVQNDQALLPPEWLKTGAVIPVTIDTVLTLLHAVRVLQSAPVPVIAQQPKECGACHGSGWMVRDSDIGTEQECSACDGSGTFDDDAATPVAQVIAQGEREAEPNTDGILTGLKDAVEEAREAGFWHSCSGCYETEDGHAVGNYPFSEALGCALGSGCRECGGLGAVWDNTDYAALEREHLGDPEKGTGIYAAVAQPIANDAQDGDSMELLRDLAKALNCATISSWQTTAAWQQQLDAANEFLQGKEGQS